MNDLAPVALVLAAMLLAAALGALVAAEETKGVYDTAEEWCVDARNGTLWTEHSVVHGGLHCELENGTVIHMADVLSEAEQP